MEEYIKLRKAAGKAIRISRKMAGLSQIELAELIGTSYQQVQKYEYGTSSMSLDRIYFITNALGITLMEFIQMIEEQYKQI
jgi:transcriptional regulator with XRE-family HTH domain